MDYFLTTEVVRVPGTMDFTDLVYVAINKKTGVHEFRWGQLSDAVRGCNLLQTALDASVAEVNK